MENAKFPQWFAEVIPDSYKRNQIRKKNPIRVQIFEMENVNVCGVPNFRNGAKLVRRGKSRLT